MKAVSISLPFSFPFRPCGWLLVLVLLNCVINEIRGATVCTWTGGSATSSYWNNVNNWSSGNIPGNGDTLIFPAVAARFDNTNNLVANRFDSIIITGGSYELNGSQITVTNGISNVGAPGSSLLNLPIRLGGVQSFTSGTAWLMIENVDLNGFDLTLSSGNMLLMGGIISGTGDIITTGIGTTDFAGREANTFRGTVTVRQGVLQLSKLSSGGVGLVSVPGDLVIGDGGGGDKADVVRLMAHANIGDTSEVRINSSGLLNLNNFSDMIGSLRLTDGEVETGIGTLTLAGPVFAAGTTEINGRLNLGSESRAWDVAPAGGLWVNAVISGTGGITKTNTGYLALTAANTFSGVLTVKGGLVEVQNAQALGATAGETVLEDNGILRLDVSAVLDEPLRATGGKLGALVPNKSWTGPMQLDGILTIDVPNAGQVLDLTNRISGSGGFTKIGPGTLRLSGTEDNVQAGVTTVGDGILEMRKTSAYAVGFGSLVVGNGLGDPGTAIARELATGQLSTIPVTVNSDGILDLNNFSDMIGSQLTLNQGGDVQTGTGTLSLYATGSVTADSSNAVCTISGKLNVGSGTCTLDAIDGSLSITAMVTGSADIVKTGGGIVYLSASNTFSGSLTIERYYLSISNPWALGGTNGGTVVNGTGILGVGSDIDVVNEPLTLNSTYGSGALWNSSGSNSWGGPITLTRDATVRVDTNEFLNVIGPIAGAGGLIKVDDGTLILSGAAHNTYDGATEVRAGILGLKKTPNFNAVPADLVIGDGVGGEAADVVRYLANYQIPTSARVTISSSGLLDLNNFFDTLGRIDFEGGEMVTGTGRATLTSTVNVLSESTVTGNLALSGSRIFDVASNATFHVDAKVGGTGSLYKRGAGTMELQLSNSFSGLTYVQAGVLSVQNSYGLGTADSGTVVAEGSSLLVQGNIVVTDEELTLSGGGAEGQGALISGAGGEVNRWSGPVTLDRDSLIEVVEGNTLSIWGAISGAGGLTKIGTGILGFQGAYANSYAGVTRVHQGHLILARSVADSAIPGDMVIGDGVGGALADAVRITAAQPQIAADSDVQIGNSGVLDLSGFTGPALPNGLHESIGALGGSGHVVLGTKRLGVGETGGSSTFSGVVTGPGGGLTKLGLGVLTLEGANTYSGMTEVNAGSLIVNGSQTASEVQIRAMATLGGNGSVGPIISRGGIVSPGVSPGVLNGGNLNLDAASTLRIELNGLSPGLGYDQLNTLGSVTLSGASLQLNLGSVPNKGGVYTILANDGNDAIAGIFAGLPDGAILTLGPATFEIHYSQGLGLNDVTLTVTKVDYSPLRLISATKAGSDLTLQWDGGWPPFTVEKKAEMTPSAVWEAVGSPVSVSNAVVPMDTPAGFYRVRSSY